MSSTYRSDFISGIRWTSFQQIGVSVLTLLRLVILTRLLSEETFGLYAVVLLIIGFTQVFSDLGLSVALFHKKDISSLEYSTLFWLNIGFNTILYLGLLLCTPFVLLYFEMPKLQNVIPIIGLNLIFAAIGKHHFVYAQKELRFDDLAKILVGVNFIGVILASIFALQGFEIYALVYTSTFITLSSSISYMVLMKRKYPIKMKFSFSSVKDTFKIGMYQSSAQIIDYISGQMDIIILSKVLSQGELGIYNIIKQLGYKVYSLTNSIVSKVAVPLFSGFNDNVQLINLRFLDILKKVSFINMIIYANLAASSVYILHILFGELYSTFFIEFELFSLLFYFTSLMSLGGVLVVSQGRTDIGLNWTIFRGLVSSILVFLGGYYFGIIGVIGGLCVFALGGFVIHFFLVVKKIQEEISLVQYLSMINRNVVLGLCIYLGVSILLLLIPLKNVFVHLIVVLAINMLMLLKFKDEFINVFSLLANKKPIR